MRYKHDDDDDTADPLCFAMASYLWSYNCDGKSWTVRCKALFNNLPSNQLADTRTHTSAEDTSHCHTDEPDPSDLLVHGKVAVTPLDPILDEDHVER